MTHKPNMVTWYSFGHTQRVIREKYREEDRPGVLPTFKEFIKYLVSISFGGGRPIESLLGRRIVTEHKKDEENDENDKRALEASLAQLCALQ